jgi:hypothetical protein
MTMTLNIIRSSALRFAATALALLTLAGCASFSSDGGFNSVEQTAKERIGKELNWARNDVDRSLIAARVQSLLQKPLSIDDAVQIALLNNRGLQASFLNWGFLKRIWWTRAAYPILISRYGAQTRAISTQSSKR